MLELLFHPSPKIHWPCEAAEKEQKHSHIVPARLSASAALSDHELYNTARWWREREEGEEGIG